MRIYAIRFYFTPSKGVGWHAQRLYTTLAGPIPHLHHYLLFNAKQGVGWHAYVAFVHYACQQLRIYAIIFYFALCKGLGVFYLLFVCFLC